jgi:hypothetical protein
MISNIFLLTTPSQLINVIEAKRHFNISANSSVAIINAYSTNLIQMKELLKQVEWSEIIFMEDDAERQKEHEQHLKNGNRLRAIKRVFQQSAKLKNLIRKYSIVKNLFVGYYLSLENIHIVNKVYYERLILLDDGIATLEVNRRRKNNISFLNAWNIEFLGRVLFKKFILGYKLNHPKSAVFFTSYNIETGPNDSIVNNDYSEIKRLVGHRETSNEVYFLGQPLSEEMPKIVTEEVYFRYIEFVMEKFKSQKVVYIPHRDEDRSKLERLKNAFNISILFNDIPFEIFLLKQPKLPRYLVGLITSAIPNCKAIFGEALNIQAIRINRSHIINKALITPVEETYVYFETLVDGKFRILSIP